MPSRTGLMIWVAILVAGFGVWSLTAADTSKAGPAEASTKLPGARAEIHAVNYASLQAAIDALPAEGGVVHLPPGTFDIDRPLVIARGDVLLQGAGASTHIRNRNESGESALVIRHPDGEKVKADQKLWRVMLSNFRITGNPKSGHGVDALLVNEIFLQGITVSEHGGDGIRLDRCYEDPRVNDCLITYNKQTGLNLPGCHDIVVSGNQFEENRDAVHCFDAYNLCFNGNCIDDHLGHGVVIENTYGSVLSGNMIEECEGIGIVLDRDCYGVTLSANVIAHNGGGIDLRDAHGCAVSANTFVLLKKPAKSKDGAQPPELDTRCLRIGPDSSRIAVTGNSFCDSYIGEGAVKRKLDDQLAGGIVLEGTRDVTISGNNFSSVPKAIELRGAASERILFTGNLITDSASDHSKLKGTIADNLAE